MPVVMVTAGASRMGWGVGKAMRELGWQVILTDINEDRLKEVSADLGGAPGVVWEHLDFTKLADVEALVKKTVKKYGSIDAMVNVGGGVRTMNLESRVDFIEIPPENWRRIFEANLFGIFNCCRAVLPYMIKQKRGGIVNVSSGMGLRGRGKISIYSAAKGAIIALGQSLAQEVAPYGIRVNTLAPGNAESIHKPDVHKFDYDGEAKRVPPMGRRASAEDIGNAIAFLLSDKSKHITGSCLDTSGGTSLH
jgi:NAD(P)-dependent dehydrogenase (short-subunit alcohol dehydrogenase family)